jgi:RNA polymerase sigma factor (sigma-70 family)
MINNTIETLPTKCREVFILSRKEFLANKEIAKKLNISENTVEQHIRKAIRRIRQSIDVVIKIILLFCLIR